MEFIYAGIALVVGLVVGFVVTRFVLQNKAKGAASDAAKLIEDAKKQADTFKREANLEAKDAAYQIKQDAERDANERLHEVKEKEARLLQREQNLDNRDNSLDKKSNAVEAREQELAKLATELGERAKKIDDAASKVQSELQRVSGLSLEQARLELLESVRDDVTRDAAAIIREGEQQAKATADKKSREILSTTIQRYAAEFTAERTVSSVAIPSDDLKGRIIGREGRNIRTFEQITGISLIIDDTPESVVISCHDPVRREVGRVTLESLISDGRIHPARIEEMFNKATKLVNEQVQEAGEAAVFDVGIHDLHPELVTTLGRLKFRTSYGQNVLQHSLEVSAFAAMMASELGLDPTDAKRAGLLHDLGKAIDHDIDGSHAVIGADLARRFGERPEIVHAIEAHHVDVEPATVLAVLVQAADAVSAARPGARRETLESYIKRLEKLESIANAHKGVERTYAMQAGREVRVMVEPEKIDDAAATVLAHDIAKQIEDEMEYPGQIRVLVIRESRSAATAK
jgi:ribonuclease Y